MKTIITGGSGLIGRALTDKLVKAGHEVVILSRNPDKVNGLPTGARAIRWDGHSSDGWLDEVNTTDAIVNLAGENLAGPGFFPTRWSEERLGRILNSRMDAGKAVVEAVERADNKPKVVIQSSAVGYYGARDSTPLTEKSPAGDDTLAKVVVEWESATARIEEMGIRRVIIRTGIYLDPQDGALQRLLLPYKMFAGGPFGNGEQYYSWIHPEDEINAILFLIENMQASGAFNLTAPQPLPNKKFGKILGKVLSRPSLIPVPAFAMKIAFGEVATVVVDGQNVLPERLLDLGYKFSFPDLESALRDLLDK